jgi:hypothetical protein
LCKAATLFHFCHLTKLVRPECFGPYHVLTTIRKKDWDDGIGSATFPMKMLQDLRAVGYREELWRSISLCEGKTRK